MTHIKKTHRIGTPWFSAPNDNLLSVCVGVVHHCFQIFSDHLVLVAKILVFHGFSMLSTPGIWCTDRPSITQNPSNRRIRWVGYKLCNYAQHATYFVEVHGPETTRNKYMLRSCKKSANSLHCEPPDGCGWRSFSGGKTSQLAFSEWHHSGWWLQYFFSIFHSGWDENYQFESFDGMMSFRWLG